jgi:hypothetical protein
MNDRDEYPLARPRELEWLASHGLYYPETAAGYVGRKLFSREVFCPCTPGIPARQRQLRSARTRKKQEQHDEDEECLERTSK